MVAFKSSVMRLATMSRITNCFFSISKRSSNDSKMPTTCRIVEFTTSPRSTSLMPNAARSGCAATIRSARSSSKLRFVKGIAVLGINAGTLYWSEAHAALACGVCDAWRRAEYSAAKAPGAPSTLPTAGVSGVARPPARAGVITRVPSPTSGDEAPAGLIGFCGRLELGTAAVGGEGTSCPLAGVGVGAGAADFSAGGSGCATLAGVGVGSGAAGFAIGGSGRAALAGAGVGAGAADSAIGGSGTAALAGTGVGAGADGFAAGGAGAATLPGAGVCAGADDFAVAASRSSALTGASADANADRAAGGGADAEASGIRLTSILPLFVLQLIQPSSEASSTVLTFKRRPSTPMPHSRTMQVIPSDNFATSSLVRLSVWRMSRPASLIETFEPTGKDLMGQGGSSVAGAVAFPAPSAGIARVVERGVDWSQMVP
mmetsp:Transcript_52297/g.114624  ORF Transcript_52297/g.114624 Transcript_52297/m.114624 type:complete len:431 (+) Transcript_52297:1472-2764(+)